MMMTVKLCIGVEKDDMYLIGDILKENWKREHGIFQFVQTAVNQRFVLRQTITINVFGFDDFYPLKTFRLLCKYSNPFISSRIL